MNPRMATTASRAFVVQLSPDADPDAGRIAGRVEHVSSGRVLHFTSSDELIAFFARLLRGNRATDAD